MIMDRQLLITVDCDSQIRVDRLEEKKFLVLDRPKAMIILNALCLVSEGSEFEISAYRDMADEVDNFIERSWA